MTNFEVGKKYKNILNKNTHIYTCTFVGTKRAFLEHGNFACVPPLDEDQGWREYKEPVVHKSTLIWYRYNGEVNTTTVHSENYLKSWKYEILKVEEITYTEGEE